MAFDGSGCYIFQNCLQSHWIQNTTPGGQSIEAAAAGAGDRRPPVERNIMGSQGEGEAADYGACYDDYDYDVYESDEDDFLESQDRSNVKLSRNRSLELVGTTQGLQEQDC